jgi:predicted transcriptional regulator
MANSAEASSTIALIEARRARRKPQDAVQQLKELETDGIVTRKDYQEVPPRVDYAVTPLGHSLAEALVPLCN